jgi:neopullulanase
MDFKLNKRLYFTLIILFFLPALSQAANSPEIIRMDPPNWWVGMKNTKLEILVSGKDIGNCSIDTKYSGVDILSIDKFQNNSYVAIQLNISALAEAGIVNFEFKSDKGKLNYGFELKKRVGNGTQLKGISPADNIYLIMPDRFSNGDNSNDNISGYYETVNRDSGFFRHGGDIQGIINHLNYVEEIGFTALWINPWLENNQPKESYHGYAFTDHYKVDPRFGDLTKLVELKKACDDKKIKFIQDIVHNHIGNEHYLFKNLPDSSWINNWQNYTRTNYRENTLFDPYASNKDKKIMTDGWFDKHMPDLNQRNKHVAAYLTQNNIWWIETLQLNSFRIDTYAYPDQEFLSGWGKAIADEYPNFNMFGETWVHGMPNQVWFTQKNGFQKPYDSNLQNVTDFQWYFSVLEALNTPFGWTSGVSKLYYTLASDFMYNNAYNNVTFLDNHDVDRFCGVVGNNVNKFKSGISLLMTSRGIPSIYYGTEILMNKNATLHSNIREDFPGGWKDDKVNKFLKSGRSEKENEAFDFIKNISLYRKNSEVLQTGKLIQFVPQDGVYVYFRYNDTKTIMIIFNSNDQSKTITTERYAEKLIDCKNAIDINTKVKFTNLKEIFLEANSTLVLELL